MNDDVKTEETVNEVWQVLGEHAGTHWGQRIIAAAERDGFIAQDSRDAHNWVTCACGKLDERIPRDGACKPFDTKLRQMGQLFSNYVQFNWYVNTAKTLVQIEERAAELLSQHVPSNHELREEA